MANMGMIGRIGCVFGAHQRSRQRAKFQERGDMLSVCRHCGALMRRHHSGKWHVERRP